MQNNHTRTAWILSLVYCCKFYYSLRKSYPLSRFKRERAAFIYMDLDDTLLNAIQVKGWDEICEHPRGILRTWLWITDR
jgi:hypothetical protein